MKAKEETSIDKLFEGYPIEFSKYMTYVRGLEFDTDPDYKFLQETF